MSREVLYRMALDSLTLDKVKLSLKRVPIYGSLRNQPLLTQSVAVDSFAPPSVMPTEISLCDFGAPGKTTTDELLAFAQHPLAGECSVEVAQAYERIASAKPRAGHHDVPGGREFFAWRHQYVRHRGGAKSVIWRWRLSLLLPRNRRARDWLGRAPQLTIALIDTWELLRPGAREHAQIRAEVLKLLQKTVFRLAQEALEAFDLSLDDAEVYDTIPVRLRIACAPQAAHHTELLSALARQMHAAATCLPEEWSRELVDAELDAGNCEVAEAAFSVLSADELASMEETARPPSPAPRQAKPRAGDTYIFLEGDCPEVLLTKSGRVCPAYLQQAYDEYLRNYRMTPAELLKLYDCDTEDFAQFEPTGEPARFVSPLRHKMRQWLADRYEDFEDPDQLEYLAEDLAAAPNFVGGFRAESALRLRVLVDKGTGVGYARLCRPTEPVATFLARAMGGGIGSPLKGRPAALQVAASYCKRHPEVAAWCAKEGVKLVHPSSGFTSGIHHLKQWRDDIRQLEYHRNVFDPQLDSERPRSEEELPSLAQAQEMLVNLAWSGAAGGLLYELSRRHLTIGGKAYFTSGSSVDGETYLKTVRPDECFDDIAQRRNEWLSSRFPG